jgi:hypothetical protein
VGGGGGELKERENLEDLGLDDILVLEWIKRGRAWTVGVWLGIPTSEDFFVHSNEHSAYTFFK